MSQEKFSYVPACKNCRHGICVLQTLPAIHATCQTARVARLVSKCGASHLLLNVVSISSVVKPAARIVSRAQGMHVP